MDVLAIVGLFLSAGGLIAVAFGLRQTRQQIEQAGDISLGDFLMRVDQMLLEYHNDVHVKLRPGGEWDTSIYPVGGPKTSAERAALETYMGLFERIYVLMKRGIIPEDLVRRFYRYRVSNIVANEQICDEKLVQNAGGWQDFIALCDVLQVPIPCRKQLN